MSISGVDYGPLSSAHICIDVMAAVWQQALALDARYNAYRTPNNPQFRKCRFNVEDNYLVNLFNRKLCLSLSVYTVAVSVSVLCQFSLRVPVVWV